MQKLHRCSVQFEDKTRCNRLATKSIKGEHICGPCYRKIKNQLLVEHELGKTPAETKASMERALKLEP